MPQDSCFLNLEDLHKYFRFLHAKGFPAVSSYLLQWSLHSRKACPAGQIHKGSECLCRSHIVLNLKIKFIAEGMFVLMCDFKKDGTAWTVIAVVEILHDRFNFRDSLVDVGELIYQNTSGVGHLAVPI